jgi:hypothetical protein
MARQTGPILFEGTISIVTGYQMNGKHYLKMKSSISRKRVLQDLQFKNTRRYAAWFGQASSIAKQVYHEVPLENRSQHGLWYPLRKKAESLVRKELPRSEIIRLLKEEFIEPLKKNMQKPVVPVATVIKQPEFSFEEIPGLSLFETGIDRTVESSLIDQLAASQAFVKNILLKKNKIIIKPRTGQRMQRFRR